MVFSPNKHESSLFITVNVTSFFSPFLGLITVSLVSPSGFRCDLFHVINFCEVGWTWFFTRWVGPGSFSQTSGNGVNICSAVKLECDVTLIDLHECSNTFARTLSAN